jgi:hypothetical protein
MSFEVQINCLGKWANADCDKNPHAMWYRRLDPALLRESV